MTVIESNRLNLRCWREKDYLDLYEIISDHKVGESAGCFVVKDIEESKNSIRTFMKYNQSYAIVLKSENKVIGSIGMDDIAPDKELISLRQRYIGYTVNSKYWGRGYATEAANAFIKYLFEELSLDLIWSSHYDFNIKSKRVIEKCGLNYKFTKDVTLRALENKNTTELFYCIYREQSSN